MNEKIDEAEGKLEVDAGTRKRVNRNLAQWSELLEAHRQSGLTIEAFCRQERISRSSFARWRGQLAASAGTDRKAADFLAIPIHGGSEIVVELGGMCLRLDGNASSRILEALLLRMRQTK